VLAPFNYDASIMVDVMFDFQLIYELHKYIMFLYKTEFKSHNTKVVVHSSVRMSCS
jgi:hypothetical protein